MRVIPLTRGNVAYVSDKDYPRLRRFKWYCSGRRDAPYAQTWKEGRPVLMHRMIAQMAGYGDAPQIDHRDGNRLNNMRSNLRPATNQQNQMNRTVVRARSGVRGVYENTNGRWQARIVVDGVQICLGTFDTIGDAAAVRKQAERSYYGRFAPRRSASQSA